MYSPLEGGFGNLSLQSPMSPKQKEAESWKTVLQEIDSQDIESRRAAIREFLSSLAQHNLPSEEMLKRKIALRDIISAFDPYLLPTEISPDAFESIDSEQRRRDPSEWTRPGDLYGTLMQWGTHNELGYEFLDAFHTPEQRAILFWQKLPRLLDEAFRKYDHPEDDLVPNVEGIADNLRSFEAAFIGDEHERPLPEETMSGREDLQTAYRTLLGAFVDALAKVCERSSDMSSSGRTRRSSSGSRRRSLYHILIANHPVTEHPFMLNLLEYVLPRSLLSFKNKLEEILRTLDGVEAPTDYRSRLAAVLKRIPVNPPSSAGRLIFRRSGPELDDDDDDDEADLAGPASGPRRSDQLSRDPPTGSKRAAPQGSGRRGRQKRETA